MSTPSNTVTLPAEKLTRKREQVAMIITIVFVVLLVIATPVAVLFTVPPGVNPALPVTASLLALLPLAFVIWALWLIDRWEPEPLMIKIATLAWGLVGSIILTILLNMFWTGLWISLGVLNNGNIDFYSIVIQAPLNEEFAKSLPLVFYLLFMRKVIDGPVDGVVLAGLSAAGFAYTENIQYFTVSLAETGDASVIFLVRGVMSPLTHALFTAMGFGIALGLVAHRSRWWILVAFPIGWGVSAFLHALWNGMSFVMSNFVVGYILIQVPLAICCALAIVWLRRAESRVTQERLTEYSHAGWLSLEEVHRLSNGDGRMQLMQWARKHGVRATMRKYIHSATALASSRQRAVKGRNYHGLQHDEVDNLAEFTRNRQQLLKGTHGDMQMAQQGTTPPSAQGGMSFQQAMMPTRPQRQPAMAGAPAPYGAGVPQGGSQVGPQGPGQQPGAGAPPQFRP